jgi:G3E family GTPase
MAFADMIVLNKVDLVDQATVDHVNAWLNSRFHRYRLIEASHGDVPLEVLLSVGRFDPERMDREVMDGGDRCSDPDPHHHHDADDHAQAFSTWTYESEQPIIPIRPSAVASFPPHVYRAKGVVYTSDAPGRRAVLKSSASAWTCRCMTSGVNGRLAHRSSSSAQPERWTTRCAT